MNEKKDRVFIFRLSERIKQALAKLAESDGVSMGETVERLIEKESKRKSAKERQISQN